MRMRILAVAMAACIPVVAFGQRTRGGGGASSDPPPTPSASLPTMKSPTSHDLADLNPAALLIGKRKKVALNDSTVAQLKAIEKKINERNAPFFAAYDSVRKWTLPISDNGSRSQGIGLSGGVGDSKIAAAGPSPAEQARMQASSRDLRGLLAEFRQRHTADDADVMAVIPDAQKKQATDLVGQQDSDVEKLASGGRP